MNTSTWWFISEDRILPLPTWLASEWFDRADRIVFLGTHEQAVAIQDAMKAPQEFLFKEVA